jgi:thiol-disulfide isomerase/thioredoxin
MTIENINDAYMANEKFLAFINKHKYVVCFYYWKHCGFCISFAPTWYTIMQTYAKYINILNIELEAVKKLKDENKVNAFPTIMLYQNGRRKKELGSRNEKYLHKFIQTNLIVKQKKQKTK